MLITKKIYFGNRNISIVGLLWSVLAVLGVLLKLRLGESKINNYLIFENVFWHTVHQTNLYAKYPAEYFDTNHYGPLFSFIIAPFAFLPTNIGCFLWAVANAVFLFYTVRKLPVSYKAQNIILLITSVEMMTSIQNVQFNPAVAAGIILSFLFVKNGRDLWATFFIAAGFLIKIYGIAGLAFIFFSENKMRFLGSLVFWMLVLFFLPMLISSPSFIFHSYQDWFYSLVEKNETNGSSLMQNISVMGILLHVFKIENNLMLVLIPAALMYLSPLVRNDQSKSAGFQLSYLAFILIGVVIFSSSAESSTYIIAMTGVGIWYILQKKFLPENLILLGFAIIFTSFANTDLMPEYLRLNIIRPYSLKALPCVVIWCVLAYQLLVKDFKLVMPV